MGIRLDLGKVLFLVLLFTLSVMAAMADNVKGQITDQQTNEPLPGATVQVEGTATGAVADADGFFILQLKQGTYNLNVSYVGYRSQLIKGLKVQGEMTLNIALIVDEQTLGEVKVTGMARHNTEASMIEAARLSDQVVSNISAQEIRRTQDNNAGEVIRRVPGVSLIEDKFVMVRGL